LVTLSERAVSALSCSCFLSTDPHFQSTNQGLLQFTVAG
jgi:hypothetical protein